MKKTKKQYKLPDWPGKLLHAALDDLEKCERSKRYKINMYKWYEPSSESVCQVCLAGSVIAKRLGNGDEFKVPSDFDKSTNYKLLALDDFRAYEFMCGLINFQLSLPKKIYDRIELILNSKLTPIEYEENKSQWKRNMRRAANIMDRELRKAKWKPSKI